MKTFQKTMLIGLVLIALTGLFGCSMVQQVVDNADPESDRLLTSFLDALGENDSDAAYQLMFPESMEQADFQDQWTILTSDWGSSRDYTFQKMSVRTSISTDRKAVSNVYIVSRENQPDYVVSLARVETGGKSGITNLSIEILLATFG